MLSRDDTSALAFACVPGPPLGRHCCGRCDCRCLLNRTFEEPPTLPVRLAPGHYLDFAPLPALARAVWRRAALAHDCQERLCRLFTGEGAGARAARSIAREDHGYLNGSVVDGAPVWLLSSTEGGRAPARRQAGGKEIELLASREIQVRNDCKSDSRVAMSNHTSMITRLPLDDKARQEGYRAGRRGRTGAANPYPLGAPEAEAWILGLADGQKRPPLRAVTGDV
jgi:hypothetical protein